VSTPVDTCSEYSLEEVGDVAHELDHFEAPLDLAEGVVDGLAVLGAELFGQVVAVRRHQVAVGEHDVLTPGERREPPRLVGLLGGRHRGVDLGPGGHRHLG
jgi:hypothetical protein